MDINGEIKRHYNRISGIYEIMDKMIKEEWRLNLLPNVSGKVLEAGIGTGANLPFYSVNINLLTGFDFSKGMLKRAQDKVGFVRTTKTGFEYSKPVFVIN